MAGQGTRRAGVYIGLGANLGDPVAQMRRALALLERDDTRVLRVSGFYATAPWGRVDQPDFVNAAAELETALAAPELVEHLLRVERLTGRSRDAERWAPRLIDLDLLLDGDARVDMPGCHVPHPRLHLRAFALLPLLELAPDVVIAGVGAARDCLAALPATEREGARPLDTRGMESLPRRAGALHP